MTDPENPEEPEDLDNWEPSPEEQARAHDLYQLGLRYPTFMLLMHVVQSHTRLKTILKLDCPDFIVQKEREMLNERLDQLSAAMPYSTELDTYSLRDILHHFRNEFMRAPGTGNDA